MKPDANVLTGEPMRQTRRATAFPGHADELLVPDLMIAAVLPPST
jgi:hypothetical protein